VTLPALRPSVGLGALLVALYTLSDFGVVSLMRYDALTRAIYLQYRSLFDRTPAAALALVLVAITAVALMLEWRTRSRGRRHRIGSGAPRKRRPARLGPWRGPALAFCAAVTTVFVLLPATVLCYWLARAYSLDRAPALPWDALAGSLLAGTVAATAAVGAAFPLGLLTVRFPSTAGRLLERLAYLGNSLPGLVIALSLVFFAARYASPVYQTFGLLVFAYVVRFFPQALSGVETALERINPRLEEASRSLGRGAVATVRSVTLPLLRSGLLAGGAIVFLSVMKELPATILLRPIGFDTLATDIWTQTQVGAYSQAALPALVLVGVSAPVLLLLSAGRRLEQPTG
jgi:iron(III) transport system permease protein